MNSLRWLIKLMRATWYTLLLVSYRKRETHTEAFSSQKGRLEEGRKVLQTTSPSRNQHVLVREPPDRLHVCRVPGEYRDAFEVPFAFVVLPVRVITASSIHGLTSYMHACTNLP